MLRRGRLHVTGTADVQIELMLNDCHRTAKVDMVDAVDARALLIACSANDNLGGLKKYRCNGAGLCAF